jgi:phage-related protein
LETVQTNEANKTRDAQQEQSNLAQTSTRSLSSAEVEGIAEFEDERDITKRNRKLADNQPEEQAENGKKEESREKEAENREQQKARKENQASQKDKALAVAGGKQPFQLPGPFSAKKRIPFPFAPKGKKGKGGKEEGEERTVENKAAAFAPLSKQTAPAAKKNNEAAPSKAEAFSPAPDAAASTPQVKAEPPAQSTQTEQVANDYLKAPLSQKVTRMNAIGSSFGKAFNADRGAVAKKTRVKASLEDNSGPPPPPPQVVKTQAPQLTEWKEPDRKAKKDDSTKVDTSGDANPSQVDAQAKADQAKAQGQQETAAKDISGLPGPEKIEGASVEMSPQLEVPDATTVPQARISPQMQNYMSMPLASFRPKVDEAAQQAWESDVAEARNTISENIQKRDEEQSKAVTETQQEAAKLETEAQQKQDAAIASSRTAIQEEKEKGMAESQAQLDEYRAKAGAERDKHLTDIENRIQKDEGRAQDELDKADKEVAKEKKKADKEKKKEEEKAEKKKKKRSFWQKIGDFFSNIAKALKKVVTAIVDTLKKVVKGIIEAARKLVNGIIEMARQFIVNAIKAFASVVKGFLEVALAAFPGIRDAVIGAIDDIVNATVEGINKAAQFLKDSVNSLVDKLNQYIDFISNFFESLIEGGFAMLQAILTGNFDQLPKIAFMTACNALGLPGEEFWKILMKAKDQALNIIKNPVGFLKNLIASGKKGFMKFMKNFGKHLQKGLMGWLFGQLGAAGVTLPKKFDLPNMFNFIRKILGFTLEYVEERIIMHVGQENIDKAKKVIDFFRKLFTEGPIALWNMFKAKLGDIRKLVMEQIQQFIVVQIVQKAVAKVISMLIPGGGFLQAILAAYQTLMFFIQNIKQIASLVNSILDSLASITRGAIGKAANYIESVMAKSLPLIFRFLAKLIGIGGIGARIAKIIEKLRTPVNKSIDNTVGKAVSGVKSGYGKAKAGARKGWSAAKASGKKGFEAARKGGIKAGLKSVKSDASEAKENAKATYHQKKEEAKAKYQETKEKATDKYKAAKSEAKSGFKGTRTAVKAKVEAKKAQAKEKYDEVKGKAQAGIDKAKGGLEKLKSKIPSPHRLIRVKGKSKTPEAEQKWGAALTDLNTLMKGVDAGNVNEATFESEANRIRTRYSFQALSVRKDGSALMLKGKLNPEFSIRVELGRRQKGRLKQLLSNNAKAVGTEFLKATTKYSKYKSKENKKAVQKLIRTERDKLKQDFIQQISNPQKSYEVLKEEINNFRELLLDAILEYRKKNKGYKEKALDFLIGFVTTGKKGGGETEAVLTDPPIGQSEDDAENTNLEDGLPWLGAIAGGIVAGKELLKFVKGAREFSEQIKGKDGIDKHLEYALMGAKSAASLTKAGAGVVTAENKIAQKDVEKPKDGSDLPTPKHVSGVTGTAFTAGAVKDLIQSIKSFKEMVTNWKDNSHIEQFNDARSTTNALVSLAGQTAKATESWIKLGGGNSIKELAPGVDIALGLVSFLNNLWDLIKNARRVKEINETLDDFKKKYGNRRDKENHSINLLKEKGNTVDEKKVAARIQTLERRKGRSGNAELKAAKDFEINRHLFNVNRRRLNTNILDIIQDGVSIGAGAAKLSGVGAPVGVAMNAGNVIFRFARKGVDVTRDQVYKHQVKKGKEPGAITGTSKAALKNKSVEIAKKLILKAGFIGVDKKTETGKRWKSLDAQFRQTGVNRALLYKQSEPKEIFKMLVDAMKS